ncbi:MAG: extracellular solute-binding protein [Ruthenibacterium sp.]
MKQSILRKTAVLLTAVMALSGVLSGCGKAKTEQSDAAAAAGGPVKITALSTWEISDIRPSKDQTLVGQWLEKELNMDLELVTIPGEGVTTKINALAASKQLPTILFTTGDTDAIAEVNKLGEKGVFVNVKDYLDKVPNYAKYLENDFVRREMADVNGNIYGFAKIYSDENIMYSTPIIRQDLLEGSPYSCEKIKTIDDLTQVLLYLTEKTKNPAWIQRMGYEGFMEKATLPWNLSTKTFYDYEKDAFTHPVLESRLKDFVLWMKDLRAKNVIHPDWAIMTDETWEGLLASDKGCFTIDRMSIIGDNNFSKAFNWQPIDYPQINGKAYLQPNQPAVAPTTSWVINAHASQTEIDKALEFINFLYDEKNHETLTLGIEDQTYTKKDPNTMAGIRWLIQIYGENADNKEAGFIYQHGIQSFTRLQTPLDMKSFPGAYPEVMYKQIDHIKNDLGGFRPATPTVAFSEEVQTKLSTMETSLNTFFDESIIAFIEGKRDMATWDQFISDIKAKGVDEIVGLYNAAYAEYKKK